MRPVTYQFKMPSFLICALEYGSDCTDDFTPEDMKALHEAEQTALDLMVENNGVMYHWSFGDEPYFTWNPDFTNLGCDVVDTYLVIMISDKE